MKKNLKTMIESIESVKVYADWIKIDGDPDLYPLPLVDGNAKIGKGIWHASTLPTSNVITCNYNGITYSEAGTCPTTCSGCYATKGNYNYENIKYYLLMRTRLLRRHADIYFQVARFQIMAENIQYIRLHASGDFIENEAAGWYKIFKEFKNVKGWTYTKREIFGDIKKLDNLNNFNIVDSIIKGCGFNYGHIDYVLKVWEKLKKAGKSVYICRCGIDKNQHCSNCTGCSKNKYVLFIEHSTGYKAGKDSLYNKIATIINNQPSQKLLA